jgi:hypothetical protein
MSLFCPRSVQEELDNLVLIEAFLSGLVILGVENEKSGGQELEVSGDHSGGQVGAYFATVLRSLDDAGNQVFHPAALGVFKWIAKPLQAVAKIDYRQVKIVRQNLVHKDNENLQLLPDIPGGWLHGGA